MFGVARCFAVALVRGFWFHGTLLRHRVGQAAQSTSSRGVGVAGERRKRLLSARPLSATRHGFYMAVYKEEVRAPAVSPGDILFPVMYVAAIHLCRRVAAVSQRRIILRKQHRRGGPNHARLMRSGVVGRFGHVVCQAVGTTKVVSHTGQVEANRGGVTGTVQNLHAFHIGLKQHISSHKDSARSGVVKRIGILRVVVGDILPEGQTQLPQVSRTTGFARPLTNTRHNRQQNGGHRCNNSHDN